MLIGLTGGIATGKSTVAAMFQRKGAVLIDADQVAREVVEPGTEGADLIRKHFGREMFTEEGYLKRQMLGKRIFQEDESRELLNRLLHPLIRYEMEQKVRKIKEGKPEALIIQDIPLLYEENLTPSVEKVIVVYVPVETQLQRLMKRNQLSRDEAIKRIQTQISIEKKKEYADFIIDNEGSLENTERQVDRIWSYLT